MIACPHCGFANIPEKTVCKQCKQPLREEPAPVSMEPATPERRRAALEAEITRQAAVGWRVTQRADTSAQLERPRTASFGVALVLFLLGIVPGIVYVVWPRKPEGLYVQVDEYGRVRRTLS